jgi:hypothetical protein
LLEQGLQVAVAAGLRLGKGVLGTGAGGGGHGGAFQAARRSLLCLTPAATRMAWALP